MTKLHHMARDEVEAPRKTGKWLRGDVPHTDWRCVEIEERPGTCEMCEVTKIVYAHRMTHEGYPLWLDCGCICAGFMTEDPATENLREFSVQVGDAYNCAIARQSRNCIAADT